MGRNNTPMESEAIMIELREVVYREGQWWIAHCLEMDVVAEGDSPFEAVSSTMELCGAKIDAAIDDGNVKAIYHPAPAEIWDLYARGKKFRKPPGMTLPTMPARVSRFETRALQMA